MRRPVYATPWMTASMVGLLHKALENSLVLELQQKIFNDYENVAQEFSAFLSAPGLDILDVGCSTGTCGSRTVDMKRHRYTGIDIVPVYVETAAKRFRDGRFMAMDARHLPFESGSFDIAMYVGVLHHMDDDTARACLAETCRVVRKGGYILVAEPVFTRGMWLSSLFLSMDRGRHIRTQRGYRELFGTATVAREGHFRLSFHRFCSCVIAV